jgi:hypothetical protein
MKGIYLSIFSYLQGWVAKGFKIKEKLDEKDERIFPILRWVLCSFRGHLRYIDAANSQEVCVCVCVCVSV